MVDAKVRAMRVMMSQAGLLKLGLHAARPQAEPPHGMLFRRTVDVPPQGDLQSLLAKWNPGVPAETVHDLMTAVCRWNQLKDSSAVRPGQTLLIPSVLPHGKEPAKPIATGHRPIRAALARPPAISPRTDFTSQVAESRMRTRAADPHPTPVASGVWVLESQEPARLSAAQLKQQLQAGIWHHPRVG
jgi:hypothetical protein